MPDVTTRAAFNRDVAPRVAASIGIPTPAPSGPSDRFAYFEDDDRVLVVAGPQEGADVDLALVYGMTWAGERRLVLALPHQYSTATLQRLPWFGEARRPELWLFSGDEVVRVVVPSRADSLAALSERLDGGTTRTEFTTASTPLHLGDRSGAVDALVDWATRHPDLDPAHRQGQRVWHCCGQRVLSIVGVRGGLRVLAGIHGSSEDLAPIVIEVGPSGVTAEDVARARDAVEAAMGRRRTPGDPMHRRDEHWLQAVLRRSPELIGVEQPALREVPAWRPLDTPAKWRRGYIDLVGMDGHGDIRLVETKVSGNDDPRLVVQALDYLTWAHAYREVLGERLGAAPGARLTLHLVIGAAADQAEETVGLPRYSAALLNGLADDVEWTVHAVHEWFGTDADPRAVSAAQRTVPAEWTSAPTRGGRNQFQDACRAAAIRWKASTPTLPAKAWQAAPYSSGDPERLYDFCLPRQMAHYNLLPHVRDEALALFARAGISWHRGIDGGPGNHLLSSQVQCVNALTRMLREPAPLIAAFGGTVDVAEVLPIEGDDLLTFEFIGPDVLGESRGGRRRRGAGSTSVDAAFRYRTSTGLTELALVEWKYTEEYRRGRPAVVSGDDVRRQRYLPLWEADDGPLRTDVVPFADMLAEPFYQLMRQQLLAHELERRHELGADVVRVIHVVSPANTAYAESLTRDSHRRAGADVEGVWTALLRRPDRYLRLDPAVFLDPAVTSDEYVARYS